MKERDKHRKVREEMKKMRFDVVVCWCLPLVNNQLWAKNLFLIDGEREKKQPSMNEGRRRMEMKNFIWLQMPRRCALIDIKNGPLFNHVHKQIHITLNSFTFVFRLFSHLYLFFTAFFLALHPWTGGRMTVMSRCFMCYLYLFRSVFGRYLHWFPWWTEAVHSFRVSLLKIVSNKSPKLDIVECRPFKLFVTTLISIELLFRKRFASFFSELKTGKKCVHLIKCRKCRKVRA